MRRRGLMLLGLLVLILSVVSCASGQLGDCADCGVYPCRVVHHEKLMVHNPEPFFNWTPDGAHLIFNRGEKIYVVDAEGTQVRKLVNANPEGLLPNGFYGDVSPDGVRVVYSTCEFTLLRNGQLQHVYEIAVINLDGTGQQRFTEGSDMDGVPAWSPNGSRIAFNSTWGITGYTGDFIFTMAADGTDVQQVFSVFTLREGLDETKLISGLSTAPPVWSPDGQRLAFLVGEGVRSVGGRWVLYTVRTDGTELTRIAEAVVPSVWSPDGKYLTFARASEIHAESGEMEEVGEADKSTGIYTVRADGTDMRQLLAPPTEEWNVTQIAWSPDGSELLIVSDQQVLITQADGTVLRSFEIPGSLEVWRQVAWSPDGSRIAVFVNSEFSNPEPPQLYTVARDGTDRRDLMYLAHDGNPAPARPLQKGP